MLKLAHTCLLNSKRMEEEIQHIHMQLQLKITLKRMEKSKCVAVRPGNTWIHLTADANCNVSVYKHSTVLQIGYENIKKALLSDNSGEKAEITQDENEWVDDAESNAVFIIGDASEDPAIDVAVDAAGGPAVENAACNTCKDMQSKLDANITELMLCRKRKG